MGLRNSRRVFACCWTWGLATGARPATGARCVPGAQCVPGARPAERPCPARCVCEIAIVVRVQHKSPSWGHVTHEGIGETDVRQIVARKIRNKTPHAPLGTFRQNTSLPGHTQHVAQDCVRFDWAYAEARRPRARSCSHVPSSWRIRQQPARAGRRKDPLRPPPSHRPRRPPGC